MAKNEVYPRGVQLHLEVGEGVKSGDPVVYGGKIPGVALTDADSSKFATVKFEGVFKLKVYGYKKPETEEEELEIKPGEPVYMKETGKVIGGASTSVLFGYVLEKVAKKEKTTKLVLLARV